MIKMITARLVGHMMRLLVPREMSVVANGISMTAYLKEPNSEKGIGIVFDDVIIQYMYYDCCR